MDDQLYRTGITMDVRQFEEKVLNLMKILNVSAAISAINLKQTRTKQLPGGLHERSNGQKLQTEEIRHEGKENNAK